uniref:F-box only protein 21 isoform X2 n=1 Tax=Myxine glutinosa TaxID=7769 RepID=UPI0035902BF6
MSPVPAVGLTAPCDPTCCGGSSSAKVQMWLCALPIIDGHLLCAVTRWPHITMGRLEDLSLNWCDLYQMRVTCSSAVSSAVRSCSACFFHKTEISTNDFEKMLNLQFPLSFIQDELERFCSSEARCLTTQYYARKALIFLQQKQIMAELQEFLRRPEKEQSLVEGAVLIARYCNPMEDVRLTHVQAQISEIADKVRHLLYKMNPTHPACNAGKGGKQMHNIALQGQVLDALNKLLYQHLRFTGNEEDYYNPLNSYLHQVLRRRKGIPISMCILYAAIARCLGLHLEPVCFPSHFILRWPQIDGALEPKDFAYVDAYSGGSVQSASVYRLARLEESVTDASFASSSTSAVLARMANNLVILGRRNPGGDRTFQLARSSLSLYLALVPEDYQYRLLQARIYLHLCIDIEQVIESLQQIHVVDPLQQGIIVHLIEQAMERRAKPAGGTEVGVKRRMDSDTERVRFAIGLVMKHKRYDYMCVIYDWDVHCEMGQEWQRTMGVNRLPGSANQPFYNVLVEDGSCRYAAQENLHLHPDPKPVSHPEVGRYFSAFLRTCYTLNPEMAALYPDDENVVKQLLSAASQ